MARYVKLFLSIGMMGTKPLNLYIGCDFSDIPEADILAAGFKPVTDYTDAELAALDIKEWMRITPFQKGPLEKIGIRV